MMEKSTYVQLDEYSIVKLQGDCNLYSINLIDNVLTLKFIYGEVELVKVLYKREYMIALLSKFRELNEVLMLENRSELSKLLWPWKEDDRGREYRSLPVLLR